MSSDKFFLLQYSVLFYWIADGLYAMHLMRDGIKSSIETIFKHKKFKFSITNSGENLQKIFLKTNFIKIGST